MSLQPLQPKQTQPDIIVPYSGVAKILKIPVFRLALGNDLVSRIIIAVHNFFSGVCQGHSFRSFSPAIAQRSVDRFVELGAEIHFVVPRDGKGEVQMMHFQAKELEKRIEALGGSWDRMNIQGKEVFGIVPPKNAGEEWFKFKEKIEHFRWKEEDGVIITCDCADIISPSAETQCFLYVHSTSTAFSSDWKRAGFYMGAKQDICFFDNGNTWKNKGRRASEESFYLEIEAVYNQIKSNYPVNCLWVGGSCGGAPVAGYLKRQLHDQGINFFAEQSFPDINDFVKPISPRFASRVKGSLNDPALPENSEDRPPTSQFGVAKLWENLQRYESMDKGKIIIVQVKDDEHISSDAYERYLEIARKVNANVKHLLYSSTIEWRHADDFFRYEAQRREFFEAVFK